MADVCAEKGCGDCPLVAFARRAASCASWTLEDSPSFV